MSNYPQEPGQYYTPDANQPPSQSNNTLKYVLFGVGGTLLILLIGILLGNMLSGDLSKTSIPVSTPSVSPTLDPTPSDEGISKTRIDEMYIDTVRTSLPDLKDMSDKEILEVTEYVCTQLDDNPSVSNVGSIMESLQVELGPYNAGFFTSSSVLAYCDDHEDIMKEHLKNLEGELNITDENANNNSTILTDTVLKEVREPLPELNSISDNELRRMSTVICQRVDNIQVEEIEDAIYSLADKESHTALQIFYISIIAVSYECPKDYDSFMEYMNTLENGQYEL